MSDEGKGAPETVDAMKVDPSFRWNLHGTTITATFATIEPQRSMGYRKTVDRLRLTTVGETRTEVTMEESLAGPLPPLLFSSDKLRAGHDALLGMLEAAAASPIPAAARRCALAT